MHRRRFVHAMTSIAAAALAGLPSSGGEGRRREKRRVIFYEDSTQMLMSGDGTMKRDHVERWVGALGGTQVDTLSWVAAIPDICFFDTRVGDRFGKNLASYDGWEWLLARNLESLINAGDDPLKVVCEIAHRLGIRVMAAFRTNDEHRGASLRAAFFVGHPEWQIPQSLAMDYSFPQVRDHRFGIIQEVVERFDVDGVELDWMRWMKIFPSGEGLKKAPILTDFLRRIRSLLDEQGRRKGRRLALGTRVAPLLKTTHELGIDLEAWIAEKLIDYVIPSEFIYNSFNLPVDEYKRITHGTDCGLYPTLHPYLDKNAGSTDGRQLTVEHYRALARSYYAQGADGVSTYNMFPQELVFAPQYTESELHEHYLHDQAKALREIGDPQMVSTRTRTYAFYAPVQLKLAERVPVMVRVPEKGSALLRFKATNMTRADILEVDVNGSAIPDQSVKRTHYLRRLYGFAPDLPQFYLYVIRIQLSNANRLDIEIGFRLLKKNEFIKDAITIRELEVEFP